MRIRSQKLYTAVLFFIILFWGGLESAEAQFFWNTDFEYGVNKSQPRKWAIEGEGEEYTGYLVNEISKTGNKSLFMSLTNSETYTILNIPGELVAGKAVSVSGYIKAQDADSLQVQLMIFNPAEGNVLASADQQLVKNSWQPTSLRTSVKESNGPNDILFALVAKGSGSFWFDAVQVKISEKVFGDDAPDFSEPTRDEIAQLNKQAIPFEMPPPGK
ncbi:hypothetical protein [Fodinibius salsisoli]|uniref:Carbohydrate binding domain-containing protein n=1 Tax=Fodinibius salsisoli TaxID=2820877 RepID=A0ABT3PMT2_9BACT|nr:hypothetical protein [Fodinibius salsisoli]MCW9707257.1 hypothetical protein [Fodinibius salsisoli]